MPKTFYGPDDGTSFKLEDGQVVLIFKASAAGVSNGVDGAIRLFLFKGGTKTATAGIVTRAEVLRPVNSCGQTKKHMDARSAEIRNNRSKGKLQNIREDEWRVSFQVGDGWGARAWQDRREEKKAAEDTAREGAELRPVTIGMGSWNRAVTLSGLGRRPWGEMA